VDIAEWLRGLGLERYTQAFQDAEVTTEVLAELTEADLRELGLPLGPRKIVLKAIECQSAPKIDPVSASNFDPFERRVLTLALGSSELAGVAERSRARVV
jgi:SAM domain (Sterile alpha motif)